MIPELGILFDAGTGVFRARDLIETSSLQIFMTHAHADHSIGLTFFLDILHEKEVDSVEVIGEQVKLDAIREHIFSEHIFPVMPPFTWKPLTGDSHELPESGKLTWIQQEHPGGSLGYRADFPDRSFALLTDTTVDMSDSKLDFVRGVDLLILSLIHI